jgi:hypothetical protein
MVGKNGGELPAGGHDRLNDEVTGDETVSATPLFAELWQPAAPVESRRRCVP